MNEYELNNMKGYQNMEDLQNNPTTKGTEVQHAHFTIGLGCFPMLRSMLNGRPFKDATSENADKHCSNFENTRKSASFSHPLLFIDSSCECKKLSLKTCAIYFKRFYNLMIVQKKNSTHMLVLTLMSFDKDFGKFRH